MCSGKFESCGPEDAGKNCVWFLHKFDTGNEETLKAVNDSES